MRALGLMRVLAAAIGLFGSITQLHAHPDVWATVSDELVFTKDGLISEIRTSWTYDKMSSAAALQSRGLSETNRNLLRDQLAPLAQDTIAGLQPYGFFTIARVHGAKQSFEDPTEAWLEFNDSALTLHTGLRFKQPIDSHDFTLEIYDETSFMDFSFRENNPVVLVNAPRECSVIVARPSDAAAQRDLLGEAYMSLKVQPIGWDAQFSNKVSVRCP
jgi:ABC-type uncharacterized transport system substrate-binding protein